MLGGLQVFQGGLERFLGRSWEIPFGPRAQMVVVFCVSEFFREKQKKNKNILLFFCVFFRNAKHEYSFGVPGQNGVLLGGLGRILGRSGGALGAKQLS